MEKDGLAKSSDTSVEKQGFISENLFKDEIERIETLDNKQD